MVLYTKLLGTYLLSASPIITTLNIIIFVNFRNGLIGLRFLGINNINQPSYFLHNLWFWIYQFREGGLTGRVLIISVHARNWCCSYLCHHFLLHTFNSFLDKSFLIFFCCALFLSCHLFIFYFLLKKLHCSIFIFSFYFSK